MTLQNHECFLKPASTLSFKQLPCQLGQKGGDRSGPEFGGTGPPPDSADMPGESRPKKYKKFQHISINMEFLSEL